MKRAIIKWWISRAIDQSQEISAWLRSQIERDPTLQRFERAARRLERDLRADSTAWLADESSRFDGQSIRSNRREGMPVRRMHSRRLNVALALAAVLLLGVFLWLQRGSEARQRPSEQARQNELATAGQLPAADSAALVAVIDASQGLVEPFVTTFPQRLRTSVISTVDIRASYPRLQVLTAEHLWNDVSSTIQNERAQLTTELRTAVTFFSQKLPRSAARLLGLGRSASAG